MASQHHTLSLHRQPALPLGSDHRLGIGEAAGQAFGPGRWALTHQGGPHGLAVAAGVLHHHHRPAPLGQRPRQPAQLVGVAPQAGHQQHPWPGLEVGGASRWGPDPQGQPLGAANHGQAHQLGANRRTGLRAACSPGAGQGHGLQRLKGPLLADQLAAPALGQADQTIELEVELPLGHRLEHIQQRNLPALLQQPAQGELQHRGAAAALRGGEQGAQFPHQLAAGPGVEQLAAETLLPEQRCREHAAQIGPTHGIQQPQPGGEVVVGGDPGAGLPIPGLQLVEVDGNLQTLQPHLQHLRGAGRAPSRQRAHRCTNQQTGGQGPEAVRACWSSRRGHPDRNPGCPSFPRRCGKWRSCA